MKTVLLTGVGGPAGRALAAQLRPFAFADDPVFTIGADMRELASSDARLVLRIPPATSSEYLATLHHLLEYYEVDLLIPTVSEELPIVAVAAPSRRLELSRLLKRSAPPKGLPPDSGLTLETDGAVQSPRARWRYPAKTCHFGGRGMSAAPGRPVCAPDFVQDCEPTTLC